MGWGWRWEVFSATVWGVFYDGRFQDCKCTLPSTETRGLPRNSATLPPRIHLRQILTQGPLISMFALHRS